MGQQVGSMSTSQGMENLLDPRATEHDLDGSSSGGVLDVTNHCHRSHLATILAFLNREIDRSATILHDLAKSLSDEFCALGEAESQEAVRERMFSATMALQNEDRIQQRLRDLQTTLSLLERALHMHDPGSGGDLDQAIIDQLKLEEIRQTFAHSVGMISALPSASGPARAPSLGDVDLF